MEARPTLREACSTEELEKIFFLRFKILREPWNQPYESARDEFESQSVNSYAELDGEVVACGRLQRTGTDTGQIRYMAVASGKQGQGFGKMILEHLEKRAREFGFRSVCLQARENAVPFYSASGYRTSAKTFLLWGQIQHYLMEKSL